ncbi:hypothetical protein HZA97_09265 [Candidatus Woesearchaeota archaeon]|nr:hypothetical protein [Candidatus Woesearchaeota archaeon]
MSEGNIFRKNCPRCEYIWISRVEKPKECPRCKNRLDRIMLREVFS